jgi:hypothetical protein
MGFVEEAYRQCNEHLRETDRKRDQTFAIYSVLFAGVVTITSGGDKFGSLRVYVYFAVAAVGTLLVAAVANYRRWHFAYVKGAAVIQALSARKLPFTPRTIDLAWRDVGYWKRPAWTLSFLGGQLQSTEALLFNGFAAVTYFAWFLFLMQLEQPPRFLPSATPRTAFIVNLVLYMAAANLFSAWLNRRAYDRGWKQHWILAPLCVQDEVAPGSGPATDSPLPPKSAAEGA